VVGSLLTFLAALQLPFLSAGQAAALTAVVAALILAWTTRPVTPALLTGAVAALAALAAEYGLHLSDELVGGASGLVLALFAFIAREQVSPVETALSRS
jgi:hypothetical protein